MTVTPGMLALLEAQPGKGSEPAEFLKKAREPAGRQDLDRAGLGYLGQR